MNNQPLNPSLPRILAIETSGRQGSIALAQGPHLLISLPLPSQNQHAATLMPAILSLTHSQNWTPNSIDHIYLSLGPGSFTGLRIAIAAARAISHVTSCKLIGIPSLDIIAHNAPPSFQFVLPILDAKRNQIFSARYTRSPDGSLSRSAEPALHDPATLLAETLSLAKGSPVALLGEGVDYHRAALLQNAPPNLTELDRSLWPGQAATVHHLGYLAAQQNQFSNPQALLPSTSASPKLKKSIAKSTISHSTKTSQ